MVVLQMMIAYPSWVIVVAVNGEDGNAHVVIGILVVDHAEPVRRVSGA
jgi:hypothetical protein